MTHLLLDKNGGNMGSDGAVAWMFNKKGQIIFFEIGETSAHQFFNHDTIPCIYLDLMTTVGIDVCEYPDSGKINISPFKEVYEKHTQVGYNKGEENIQMIWDKLKNK